MEKLIIYYPYKAIIKYKGEFKIIVNDEPDPETRDDLRNSNLLDKIIDKWKSNHIYYDFATDEDAINTYNAVVDVWKQFGIEAFNGSIDSNIIKGIELECVDIIETSLNKYHAYFHKDIIEEFNELKANIAIAKFMGYVLATEDYIDGWLGNRAEWNKGRRPTNKSHIPLMMKNGNFEPLFNDSFVYNTSWTALMKVYYKLMKEHTISDKKALGNIVHSLIECDIQLTYEYIAKYLISIGY